MNNAAIAPAIRRFILTSIASVPHLEALLLLRADPAGHWTGDTLSRRLYIGEKTATELLRNLAAAGIAECVAPTADEYRYRPCSPELRSLLDELASTYSAHLLEVTHLIHSRTDRKAQQFADAFKWRKDT